MHLSGHVLLLTFLQVALPSTITHGKFFSLIFYSFFLSPFSLFYFIYEITPLLPDPISLPHNSQPLFAIICRCCPWKSRQRSTGDSLLSSKNPELWQPFSPAVNSVDESRFVVSDRIFIENFRSGCKKLRFGVGYMGCRW